MTTDIATVTREDVDRRLTTVELALSGFTQDTRRRFADMDRRFDAVDRRLDVLEAKVDRILALLEDTDRRNG